MEPKLQTIQQKLLVGKSMEMSLATNHTRTLWQSFMPLRNSIPNTAGTTLFSLQEYDPAYFTQFHPNRLFKKWALIEVTDFTAVPGGMEAYTLPAGDYAVFSYKGNATAAAGIFNYIFTEWLPASGYLLDNRPHFEMLTEKYKNDDPSSEEEIWIPIQRP
ncbi:AraC family transcriptional regulator [Chitinophaga skermanii]|uniref:AraC family transcriptional regulator n=1 Tax=Chitinophaga skermanii TaxID=331697 RepID=A0A327QMB5_9BACT|nr:GyrI-like domain-containing protein [Chitinophaga skermanii]RAJ05401.1 AraC family transcriptional regulator [Chitinophaga skermanii]